MKTKIIIFWLAGMIMAGCEDFLTVTPETALSSSTFFKSEADFKQAINAVYVPLRNIVNDRAYLLSEMHSDNTYYARNILFGATEQQEDIADFAVPTANGITSNVHVLNQYRLDYLIIARANQILATIDNVEFDAVSKNNLKGQAHFLRAYAYFELAQYFGKVPLHLEPVSVRQEAALPLSEVSAIYTQIIADATAATTELLARGATGFEEGRASIGAAKTLLGTVYLVQKNWAQAEIQFKDVVNSGKYSLMPDYNNAFTTSTANKNNVESIFQVQFLEGAAGLNGTFMYNFMPRPMSGAELRTLSQTANPQDLTGEGNNTPTPDIIAAYEVGDSRRDASIGYVTLSNSLRANKVYPYIKKFVRPHALHNNHGMNFPIYRYSEVLLSLAEVLNEQGKGSEAAPYIKTVRNRAGLSDVSPTLDLRVAIANDRRVELAFENKRWFDLVRTGQAIAVITAYGNRIKANPLDYYYPAGAVPRSNAFSNISLLYGLPADESSLSPYF